MASAAGEVSTGGSGDRGRAQRGEGGRARRQPWAGTARRARSGGGSADLMTELSAAGTFSTDCEDIFDERPELRSPIPGAQRHISRLVSNCLDLAAIIKEQP